MHINPDDLTLNTESDVEQKLIMPLLWGGEYLAIPQWSIRTKEYLAPAPLDKAAGRTGGYYPDYSIWKSGFLVMVVEAKPPDVAVEVGYREASLYARHLNQSYPADLNPTNFVISCNGRRIFYGTWDSKPAGEIAITDLQVGSVALDKLKEFCGNHVLDIHAHRCLAAIRPKKSVRPFNIAGDQAPLNSKKPLNTFAAELSPILRRYFSSVNEEEHREIVTRGYVSTAEITEYDRVLESLLKEKLNVRRDTVVKRLEPTRHAEPRCVHCQLYGKRNSSRENPSGGSV